MADNVTTQSTAPATPPASTPLASRQITYSGDSGVQLPAGAIVLVAGADDAKTNADLSGGAGVTDADTVRVVPATDGTVLGPVTETAPATDTASSGLNGRLQRIAQRLTSLIALLPSALGSGGGLKVDGSGTALPVSGTVTITPSGTQTVSGTVTANAGTNLNTSALALDATLTGGTQKTKIVDSGGTNVATVSAGGAVKVDGSAVTQPVSGTVTTSPPSHASTNVDQIAGTTPDVNSGNKSNGTLRVVIATDQPALTAALKVDPSGVTSPISAASLPLPTGAATAAKQPALGTAGTPSPDVITVQGAASMTALKVDGSGVTQPVSGTVTVNAGTNLNTSALALETGGNLATIAGAISSTKMKTTATTQWAAAPVSRSTGLTTELNSLANGGYSAQGTAFDNTSNLDEFAACDIALASLNPTAGAYLQIFLSQSLDGTTYEDAPSSTNPGTHQLVATVLVTTGSAAKRIMTPWFRIPPGKFKLVLLNQTGVALGASANTVTLYTSNDKAS